MAETLQERKKRANKYVNDALLILEEKGYQSGDIVDGLRAVKEYIQSGWLPQLKDE